MKRIRRVLFATDFSAASTKALPTAMALAHTHGATLMIVHVFVPLMPVVPEQYISGTTVDQLNAEARLASQRHLDTMVRKARKAGLRSTGTIVEGEPAAKIVKAARARKADLIVVGTHGRTGVSKLFMGSVAQRVITMAPCPVVIVRR